MNAQPAPVRLVRAYEQGLRDTEAPADASLPIYARVASRWFVRWFVVGHIRTSAATLGDALQRRALLASPPAAPTSDAALLREFAEALPEVRHSRSVGALLVAVAIIPLVITRALEPEANLVLDAARSVLTLDGVGLAETWRASDPSMLGWSLELLLVSVTLAGAVPVASFCSKRAVFQRHGIYDIEREVASGIDVRPHREVGWDLVAVGVLAGLFGVRLWLWVLDFGDIVVATTIGSLFCAGIVALRGFALARHGLMWTRRHTVTYSALVVVTAVALVAIGTSAWMEATRVTLVTITSAEVTESPATFGEVIDGTGGTPTESGPLVDYLESVGRPANQDTLRSLQGVAVAYEARFEGARRCRCFSRATIHDVATRSPLAEEWYSVERSIPLRSSDAGTSADTLWVLAPEVAGEYFVKLEIFVIESVDDPDDVPADRHVEEIEIVLGDGSRERLLRSFRRLAGADTEAFQVPG
jgi:hypothetical protein